MKDINDIKVMEDVLSKAGINSKDGYAYKMFELRNAGHHFSFDEHIKAMILSLLSANRPWKQIVDNLDCLKEIFYGWDAEAIKQASATALAYEVCSIGCGNRAIDRQMEGLSYNIDLFQKLQDRVKDLDLLVDEDPFKVSDLLSSNPWKLKGFAQTLALQYLRNVGVDTCKPDVHIRRILSRIGFISCEDCSIREIMDTMNLLSTQLDMPVTLINEIVWHYGASGYLPVCTKTPSCKFCFITDCDYRLERGIYE